MTKTNITLSAYQLVVKMDEGSLTFDNIIQRGPAWDSDRDSLLINSMLIGYPIPAFYMERGDVIQIPKKSGVRKLDCWDGYQRSHAIYRYMKNEYPLSVHELVDGNDYYGYTYEKLPDDLQETIKNYQFLVYLFEDTTFSEITEMFFRLNNGKPLTNIEIVRTRIKDLSNIRSLAQHEFFEVAFTRSARVGFKHESLVWTVWLLMYSDTRSLEKQSVLKAAPLIDVTDEQSAELKRIFDLLLSSVQELKKSKDKEHRVVSRHIIKQRHLNTLIPCMSVAVDENRTPEEIAAWMVTFYTADGWTTRNKYNEAGGKSSSKAPNVTARLKAVEESYRKAFK